MLSVNPNLTAAQLKTIIQNTAKHTGTFDPQGNEVLLLDAFRAVQQAQPPSGTFLSFTEGNPGLPGDGILITAESSGQFFNEFVLTTPVPLGQATDGITITVFPGTGVSNFGNAGFDITTTASAPCSVQFGSATGPTGQVVFNGVTGVFTNVPLSTLLFDLSFANFVANIQHPGCVLTLSDLQIQTLDMFTVFATPITSLDAASISLGQNAFPGTRIQ